MYAPWLIRRHGMYVPRLSMYIPCHIAWRIAAQQHPGYRLHTALLIRGNYKYVPRLVRGGIHIYLRIP